MLLLATRAYLSAIARDALVHVIPVVTDLRSPTAFVALRLLNSMYAPIGSSTCLTGGPWLPAWAEVSFSRLITLVTLRPVLAVFTDLSTTTTLLLTVVFVGAVFAYLRGLAPFRAPVASFEVVANCRSADAKFFALDTSPPLVRYSVHTWVANAFSSDAKNEALGAVRPFVRFAVITFVGFGG